MVAAQRSYRGDDGGNNQTTGGDQSTSGTQSPGAKPPTKPTAKPTAKPTTKPTAAPTKPAQPTQPADANCGAVTLGASPSSPQSVGVTVVLTGGAPGCPNPEFEFWILPPSGTWSVLQSWSPNATASWHTAGLAVGNYDFDVWARQAGSGDQQEVHISRIARYGLQASTACTSVAWNAPSLPSPQSPGAEVGLSGTASGCTSPLYQFWILPPGGPWTILQPYSPSSAVLWDTTLLVTGTYSFDIWVKQTGSTAEWEAHLSPNPTYTLQPPPPCSSVTWNTPKPAEPQSPGTQITLSGVAAGCPNPQYQFWIQPPGGVWMILQAYSSSGTAVWNTTGAATGTYLFDIWAKQAGSSASWEAHISPNPTYTLQPPPPCSSVTWNTPIPAAPQAPGTLVTLGGVAAGCPNPEYQFWIQPPGGAWAILQAYSSSSTAVWNTGGAATGTYLFDVWARQLGSPAGWEAHISPNPSYLLQTGPPCTSATLAFSPASPSTAGTSIQLNATSSGCPNPTYQFWVQAPGGVWTLLQSYSGSATATWSTTGLAPGTYLFDVWVLQAGNSAQWEAHIAPNPTYTLS